MLNNPEEEDTRCTRGGEDKPGSELAEERTDATDTGDARPADIAAELPSSCGDDTSTFARLNRSNASSCDEWLLPTGAGAVCGSDDSAS
jgi:hypothetical protein